MNGEFADRFRRVRAWAGNAHSQGWLEEADIAALDSVETESAGDLFREADRRPLLVGLFGGTGVGKSSLLNRLAGQQIAKTGVTRPTSTQATMYVHRSQTLNAFSVDSPVADTRVEYHDVEDRRDVAWLDMPDIDSVETDNRRLVLAWLPYIDWLIYVVSPERYRDDIGWRLIERRHRKHHWLFVINRWDEAVNIQLNEFVTDLEAAGFTEPVVLRTSCLQQSDDFEQLEGIIDRAIRDHGLAELQRIGVLARLEELDVLCDSMMHKIGSDNDWKEMQKKINEMIDRRLAAIKDRLGAELEAIVQRFPSVPALWRADPDPPALPEEELRLTIGSEYNAGLIANIGADITIAVEAGGMQSRPLRTRVEQTLATANQTVVNESRNGLSEAMYNPGGPVRRVLRRAMKSAAYALPVAAGMWVGYNVIRGYQQGITGEQSFLGIDFAVHSLLLIGLAGLIPFLLSRWLRPSLRTAARRGIRVGLDKAVDAIKTSLMQSFKASMREREKLAERFPHS
jgi:predicted GTPase